MNAKKIAVAPAVVVLVAALALCGVAYAAVANASVANNGNTADAGNTVIDLYKENAQGADVRVDNLAFSSALVKFTEQKTQEGVIGYGTTAAEYQMSIDTLKFKIEGNDGTNDYTAEDKFTVKVTVQMPDVDDDKLAELAIVYQKFVMKIDNDAGHDIAIASLGTGVQFTINNVSAAETHSISMVAKMVTTDLPTEIDDEPISIEDLMDFAEITGLNVKFEVVETA